VRARGLDDEVSRPVQPPERRAEAGACAVVRGVDPECPCHVHALERVLVEREERQEPLRAQRQIHEAAVAAQLERVQKRQRCAIRRRGRRRATLPLCNRAHRVASQTSAKGGDRRYEMKEGKEPSFVGVSRYLARS
jgi:hypothetical protein